MAELHSTLEYQQSRPVQRRMALENTGAGATLVFAVVHPALALLSISASLAIAAMTAYVLASIVRFAVQWQMDLTSREWIKVILIHGLGVVMWGACAAYEIMWFRKLRRVPRQLGFDKAEFFWQWPTWRGLRERRWPMDQIIEARCDNLKSIIPGVVGAELRIRLRTKRWPLRFRLGGYKVALGHRFVELLHEALQAGTSVLDDRSQ